ncbi:MAG: hypothetical protein AAFY76_04685, partial [Cyanobacteria bacterium J06649_11]
MTFQPDNEKLGIYNCNSKNPNEEDLPLISEIERINKEIEKDKKDEVTKRRLAQEQLAAINITEDRILSITRFFEVMFPGKDITSPNNGIRYRKKFLYGGGWENYKEPRT